MQVLSRKKIFFCKFALFLQLLLNPLLAQQKDLAPIGIEKADQLFSSQDYLAALTSYQQLLEQGEPSPRMLLKMAFMSEALEDYTQTLYYLSLYYHLSPDTKTLEKMESLAMAHRLKGYEHSDFDVITTIYRGNIEYFVFFFLLLNFGLFYLIIRKRYKFTEVPSRYGFIFIFILASIFYLLNFTEGELKAIIAKDNTYLMKAPSAGATPLDILEKGHRLEVIEKKDIWLKVRWQEKEAFVHKENLLLIDLKEK